MTKSKTPTAKSTPLQVRLDAKSQEKIREIAGPGGTSAWIRDAVEVALKASNTSIGDRKKEAEKEPKNLQIEGIQDLLSAALEQKYHNEKTSKRLVSVEDTTDKLVILVRQLLAITLALAGPIGISDSEIESILTSLKGQK